MDLELVGPHEIAEMLGVTRQRVHQLSKQEDFPRPVAELELGRVWLADEVRAWIAHRPGKKGDRRPSDS